MSESVHPNTDAVVAGVKSLVFPLAPADLVSGTGGRVCRVAASG